MHTPTSQTPVPYEAEKSIICIVYLATGMENRRLRAAPRSTNTENQSFLVWFTASDEEIDFEDSHGRHSLGGREVESYKCI